MTAAEADEVRRAFARPNNEHLIATHWERFAEGARRNGVPEEAAEKIFPKINGHYMFPESHSHAFAVSAYQASWLKRHYPVEFFVALMNNQPMGFYPKGHLMEFLRPTLGPGVLPTAEVEERGEDEPVTVAGWPVARQHPQGRNGTVFVTIEDETGDTQVIVHSDLFARRRRELNSQVIVVTGRVSMWDGTVNVVANDLRAVHSGVAMPQSHDWH